METESRKDRLDATCDALLTLCSQMEEDEEPDEEGMDTQTRAMIILSVAVFHYSRMTKRSPKDVVTLLRDGQLVLSFSSTGDLTIECVMHS